MLCFFFFFFFFKFIDHLKCCHYLKTEPFHKPTLHIWKSWVGRKCRVSKPTVCAIRGGRFTYQNQSLFAGASRGRKGKSSWIHVHESYNDSIHLSWLVLTSLSNRTPPSTFQSSQKALPHRYPVNSITTIKLTRTIHCLQIAQGIRDNCQHFTVQHIIL